MKIYQNSKITALEVWHGVTPYGDLDKLSGKALYPALLSFLEDLFQGKAQTALMDDTQTLKLAHGFEKIILKGGGAPDFYTFLQSRQLPYPIELVTEYKGLSGFDLTVDWGQTTIKVTGPSLHRQIKRDTQKFPLRLTNDVSTFEDIEKLNNLLNLILNDFSDLKSLCLALPVKINESFYAEPSTYKGLEGDLRQVFAASNLPAHSVVVNDAVLAAATLDIQTSKTLVLTLGFGVGAALWNP